jgi:crotonobetaine/carnitine-CoA ligase
MSRVLLERQRSEGRELSTVDLLWARTLATPDAAFLMWNNQQYTYADIWTRVLQFAAAVRRLGCGPNRGRVATYLSNCPEAVCAMFGTHAAGAVHVAINRQHRASILLDMLRRSKARVLITDAAAIAELAEYLSFDGAGIDVVVSVDRCSSKLGTVTVLSYDDLLTGDLLAPVTVDPLGPATVLYTSGSTGRAKAVLIPHAMFTRGARQIFEAAQMTDEDVLHLWAPLYHVAGPLDLLLPLVIAGGRVMLVPRLSVKAFWDDVDRHGCTIFFGFPSVLELLAAVRPSRRTTSLRVGIVGGVSNELRNRFDLEIGVRLVDAYGMTEAEPIAVSRLDAHAPPGSCGRPTGDWEVRIVNADDSDVGVAVRGEIIARPTRPGVMMLGYEDDEPATLWSLRNGWWHTGDEGFVDREGYLFVTGRLHDMIRRKGENVSPVELERLITAHAMIKSCCALNVESPLGDHDVKIVVVPIDGATVDPPALHAWCQRRMATFMVPRFIEVRHELPMTATGKIARDELRRSVRTTWDSQDLRVLRHGDS